MFDFWQPHPGKMITHGASRNAYVTALVKFGGNRLAGCFPTSDDIDGELLNKLGLDVGTDPVIGFLTLPFV